MKRAPWLIAGMLVASLACAATRPKLLQKTAPAYPPAEEAAHHGGRVELKITVKDDGTVDAVQVAKGTGFAALDQAAVDAAKAWRFAPATDDAGKPVASEVTFALNFTPPARDIDHKLTCRGLGEQVAALRATAPEAGLENAPALGALQDIAAATDAVLPADLRGSLLASMPKLYDDLLVACATQPERPYFDVYMDVTGASAAGKKRRH